MELVETPIFTRQVTASLDPDDYRLFQLHLLQHPDEGAVIRESGGLRKVRWGLKGRGKRGGIRIIYFWDVAAGRLYLLLPLPQE
jgi:mRNA-degrading endonuclease RelE of RelBE toxin-antitoxin system